VRKFLKPAKTFFGILLSVMRWQGTLSLRKKPFLFCTFSFVLFLLFSSPVAEAIDSFEQKTFLWKVQSESSTAYLLGSIHFMQQAAYPLDKRIEQAFEGSDVLAVEANINDISKIDMKKLITTAFYQESESLDRHLSPETLDLVSKEFGRFGMPMAVVSRQKPWFLALTLTSLELIRQGFDPNMGIDMHFLSKASGKKKIVELESVDYQIDLLSGFSDREQETLLAYTIEDIKTFGDSPRQLTDAWQKGDTGTVASMVIGSMTKDPWMYSIYEKLVIERNRRMASRIEDFLLSGDIHFIVVGAAHLVGEKGIPSLLREKGYRVGQM
jgi:uncharacterized protein YbaP (TraB family)